MTVDCLTLGLLILIHLSFIIRIFLYLSLELS